MGYEKFFNIGDRITITDGKEVYNSKIVRFVKKLKGIEHIIILLPTKNSIPLRATDDVKKRFEVLFYTRGGVYKGEFKIIDRYKEDGVVAVLEIAITSDLEKYQRREYFRIDYIDNIEFRILLSKNADTDEYDVLEDTWHKGTLTNISGGGLRFNSREGVENAVKMEVEFKLKDRSGVNVYNLEADIVGVKIRSNTDKRYDYRIQFTNITKVDRENIVRFVFEQERYMRKKSIGKI